MFKKSIISTTIVCMLGLMALEAIAGNHTTKQTGARNRVWTQGITGDANSTVAIFDTGIDVNHQALGPYYGNGDWRGKTVFWYHHGGDQPGDDHTSFGPGHGSHAAGIIAGSGFGAVDSQGRVVNTNAYTSGLNGEYPEQTAIVVDQIGTIRIEYAFNSDKGDVTYLELRKGNKELTYDLSDGRTVVGDTVTVGRINDPIGTPKLNAKDTEVELDDIQWNVLEYTVTDPAQFGTYHVITKRIIESSGMFSPKMHFVYVARWPANINVDGTDPADNLPYYMGMAPDTKLFAVKATSASEFETTLNELWTELSTYHTVVVNLSAGSSSLSDSGPIWSELEAMGITGINAAGNETGTAGIVAPANLPGTVAVGGLTSAETIPWYVNSGPELDILAPGGSNMTGGGVISVHNSQGNFNMAGSAWGYDYVTNDGMGMQGTSMAAPSAAGVFALVYDALGGWDNFVNNDNFAVAGTLLDKRAKVRHVKRLVFMSATELNTKREQTKLSFSNISDYYPVLNRGYDPDLDVVSQNYGKDNNEGYGRVNVDAAVDAVLHGIAPSESVNLALVSSQATWTSTDLTPLGMYSGEYRLEKAQQPKAFARHINVTEAQLSTVYGSGDAHLVLDVPAGADFDLFIYQPATGPNGQPLLLSRSVNAGSGVNEMVSFQPDVAGQYYVVVKAVSGEGSATLTFNAEPCSDCEPDPVAPTAQFTAVSRELTVDFTDTSVDSDGRIIAWSWDFGDGNTSTQQDPSHTYGLDGSYNVRLTVTDNDALTSSSTQIVQVSSDDNSQPNDGELINGVATEGIEVGDQASLIYYIDVVENALPLSLVLDGNNGDADLYVKYGSEPTTSDYDRKSTSFDSTEDISIGSPQAGRYYVLVYGYNASTDLTLTATYAVDEPVDGPRYVNPTPMEIGTQADIVIISEINVTHTGDIGRVEVAVDISHTYIGDLELNLIAPDGSKHLLRARSGGSANDIVESYSVNLGTLDAYGVWILEVRDHASRDGGQLNNWYLQFQ